MVHRLPMQMFARAEADFEPNVVDYNITSP
jgi:hypothetical protein